VEEAQASFINAPTHAEAAATSQRAKQIAAQVGKPLKTYAMVMIIPGETTAAGIARMEHYNGCSPLRGGTCRLISYCFFVFFGVQAIVFW